MNDIECLVPTLSLLDSAPKFIRKRRDKVLKKFAWTKASQLSELLRLGLWLDLLGKHDASMKVFSFLSKPDFSGNWDLWACTQAALLFMGFDAERQGTASGGIFDRALAPGFVKERHDAGLEKLMGYYLRGTKTGPFCEPNCYLLEEIILGLREIRAVGGSAVFPISRISELEEGYRSDLLRFANEISVDG